MVARSPLLELHADTFAWSMLAAAPYATIVVASDGELAYANDHAAELFGYPLDELVGRLLTALEKNKDVVVEIVEVHSKNKPVDAKLVEIARARGAAIMTTDYNLNRVAEIQRVSVLNVNELANALRPPVDSRGP